MLDEEELIKYWNASRYSHMKISLPGDWHNNFNKNGHIKLEFIIPGIFVRSYEKT